MQDPEWVLTEGLSLLVGVGVFFLLLLSQRGGEAKKERAIERVEREGPAPAPVSAPEEEVKSEEEHWVLFVEAVTGCRYEDIAQHEHYESRFPPCILSDFGDLRLSNEAISWGLDEFVAREMGDASLWVISKERD